MDLSPSDLIMSTSESRITRRVAAARGLTRILFSACIPAHLLADGQAPWIVRQRVAQARLLCVAARMSPSSNFAFTGESALVLRGAPPWWNNPDVTIRRPLRTGVPSELPPVYTQSATVPAVRLRQTDSCAGTLDQTNLTRDRLPIVPPHMVVLDSVRHGHLLQAFHNVSSLVRNEVAFRREDLEGSRRRERAFKGFVSMNLRGLGEASRKSPNRLSRALDLLGAADAGIESPTESIVLWLLKCMLPATEVIETQRPFITAGRRRNVDVALPGHRVAVEATGFGKYGDSSASAHAVAKAAVMRQQDLEDLGWSTINVTYEQALQPLTLVGYLRHRLARHGVLTCDPSGPLWEAPTWELFARTRRF